LIEWGDHLERLNEVEEVTGQKPKALRNMPRLPPTLQVDLDAFLLISPGRRQTMTGHLGPLPYTEISAYARDYPVRDRDRFVRLMRRLDLIYMRAHKAKSTRSTEVK
jgi:hypothetical protein